ncbi:hypothetical protein B0J13DRAFT_471598 [Dactylonectria estremocensis]|uniref:XPG-I domain-containing protein n=1 Tax=Dactylonectria estremocensis TaxID=1079267 RepID=A0A9P9JB95_9HYPO|nr:hypothetical protein B0J13DRAFT_471598 [Dactylonectria estremocensis]
MGIKGIYNEIGRGQRVSLSKLAADSFVNSGRPLRLAVDIAIWQFQTQAARGGTNPAIRTLFYRLNRLLGTPIEPIFVFDGPNKPVFKRNKRSGRGDGVATAQAKRLIRLFGFTVHDAPGEAEAECALLQQHGIVDAVLSEDVDTIMFGCTRTLRNWSAEGKGSKTPTHVSQYDVESMKIRELGLGREGMVLVALMSGGDYMPEGIPRCGVKVACEAAKAGFGKSVCRLKASDKKGIQAWRESLLHELKTNEKGFFRTRHMALVMPDDFPNLEVLRYYTHPVVSPISSLDAIRDKFLNQKRELYLEDLREFTRETFDWDFRIGAIKFIRVLGPTLLVKNILQQPECTHLEKIKGSRSHFSTDSTRELRVSFIPQDVVPIDLSKEVDEDIAAGRGGLALNSDDEFEAPGNGVQTNGAPKAVVKNVYDPAEPELAWVLEAVARHSLPAAVEEWEAAEAAKAVKRAPAKKKTTGSKTKSATGMPSGALDRFVQISKSRLQDATSKISKDAGRPKPTSTSLPLATTSRRLRVPSPLEPSKHSTPETRTKIAPVEQRTPWTIASSQATPRSSGPQGQQAIVISSSPPDSPSPSTFRQPRVFAASSPELPESVRSILFSSTTTKGVEEKLKLIDDTKPSQKTSVLKAQPAKLKQASMDVFTTKVSRPSASQPIMSRPPTARVEPMAASQPVDEFDEFSDLSDFNDSSSDLEPLSTLISRSSTSPTKRRNEVPNTRDTSPSPAPVRKKKLLIPRTSAVGFFREVEVDAGECEERIAREDASLQRRGMRGRVTRMSDIEVVDLTQDD